MAQQEQQSAAPPLFNPASWQIAVDCFNGLMLFSSMSVMVFMRRKVGYRQLQPTRLIGMSLVLGLAAYLFANLPSSLPLIGMRQAPTVSPEAVTNGFVLGTFAVAMVVIGLIQRHQRWNDICHGVRWHTWSLGLSYFEFLPLPVGIVYRFVDPVVCFLIGMVVHNVSPALGFWVELSAFALAYVEQVSFQGALDRDLDLLDGLVESEIQASVMEHYSDGTGQSTEQPLSIMDTAGISTGIAPDIKKQIALRRKRVPLAAVVPNTDTNRTGEESVARFAPDNLA